MLFETIKNNHFWNKYGLALAWGLSLLMLVFAIAYTAWFGYKHYKAQQTGYVSNAAVITSQQSLRPSFNASDITSAKLFGDTTPKVVKRVAPKTTLNLKLQGILSASSPQTARAIIATGNGKANLYSIGDSIEGANASIDSINPNEVLLNRGGAIERLPLVKKTTSGNRSIVQFNTPQPIEPFENTPAPSAVTQQTDVNQFNNPTKTRAVNGKPRKIKKPNFSGLDQALKKLDN